MKNKYYLLQVIIFMTSCKNSADDKAAIATIIAAVIGGVFAVFAALIPILKSRNTKTDTPKTEQESDENFELIYDSSKDECIGTNWTSYSTSSNCAIELIVPEKGFLLRANDSTEVGINKSINSLKGFVEFEYKIMSINNTKDNIIIYAIPMQENSFNKSGYIEVGTNKQDHPDNRFSPFRQRIIINKVKSEWTKGKIAFDFRDTPTAFYTIFAPRINEGCPRATNGELLIRNIKIFKS